jgi:ADP-heptose:LPS heptosyltransferase/predicted SAM-dependent methyltransferase
MVWRAEDPQGYESAKIRWELPRYTRGHGLDIGCGPEKAYPHMIGVDNGHHEENFRIRCAADIRVETCERLEIFGSQSMDFVFSAHTLEHIENYKGALKEWWRLVKPGGHLVLYLPHKLFYPNIGDKNGNPDHKHDFLPKDIVEAMKEIGFWDLRRNEDRSEGREYSFFQVFQKIQGREHRYSYKNPKPEKTCAVLRYGAVGDMIVMSSILPYLKEQGYHITLYASPYGYEAVQHDPHIDDVYLQDVDQVPNHVLGLFWHNEMKKYDKWVNLSGTVEDYLLPDREKAPFYWPDEVRRKFFDRNYLEVTHEIAQVPLPPKAKFYPTRDELAWARQQRSRIKGKVVLWSLSGSSVHKTWPHMDAIIARIMLHTDATVILVGGRLEKILQCGWENETRVWKRAGDWSLRQSLSFASIANLVIGSETGLLNAVGCEEMQKIVMLSHSSANNLTKHWKNTITLIPPTAIKCYPCHRLHQSFEFCFQDEETGSAVCQAAIDIEKVWDAVITSLGSEHAIRFATA